jgi:two-component system phosphate regulon response regulator PhoB
MSQQRVLIVDDEDDLRRLVDFNLRAVGLDTLQAPTGTEALRLAERERPDLVILDLMLPDLQGMEVCRRLKQNPATREIPVLILSARGDEIDRVVGFEVGADDYVVKPFSVRELTLRVKAILTRASLEDELTPSPSSPEPPQPQDELRFGPLKIDRTRHRAWCGDDELGLTVLEFKLLVAFITRRGRVLTRDRLLEEVWEMDAGVTTRTVDTHIKRLRQKLGEAARYLETVRGVGYRFSETPEEAPP